MVFAETAKRHIFKYNTLLGIGCGILVVVLGLYSLTIRGNIGIGFILIGISFITLNFLQRKLMLICTVVILGLALWIIIFKPFSNPGDDTARKAVGVQQEAVGQAPKPNNVLSDIATDKELNTHDVINQLMPPELRDDPMIQKMMVVTASDSFQEQVKAQNPQRPLTDREIALHPGHRPGESTRRGTIQKLVEKGD